MEWYFEILGFNEKKELRIQGLWDNWFQSYYFFHRKIWFCVIAIICYFVLLYNFHLSILLVSTQLSIAYVLSCKFDTNRKISSRLETIWDVNKHVFFQALICKLINNAKVCESKICYLWTKSKVYELFNWRNWVNENYSDVRTYITPY